MARDPARRFLKKDSGIEPLKDNRQPLKQERCFTISPVATLNLRPT